MTLRFILGRSGSGKSDHMLTEITDKIIQDPRGPAIFYLVPDQMTFQQEKALFNQDGIAGSIRAQVVNFSRLAWRVLQETGGGTRKFISSVGIQMLLRKIVDAKGTDWKVFEKSLEKQGFLQKLEQIITEFKRYQVTPQSLQFYIDEIDSFVHQTPTEKKLVNKLADLQYIYEELTKYLAQQYIDAEDHLLLLNDRIQEATILEHAEIYIDGFHGFTPLEQQVIVTLMKKCKRVTVALTMDPSQTEASSELDLFYQTIHTYQALKDAAMANGIGLEENVILDGSNGRFENRPYFAHLERYFDTRPAPVFQDDAPIKLAEAVHPRAEVEGVAQEIMRLVREENYRFRDMAIFIREPETYHDLISTIFGDYQIPVFIDEKETMLNHPLIEFIRSLLDVVEGNWRYDAVFRVLKTGLIPSTNEIYPLDADAIDELENYVLEYGIRSRQQWFGEDWKYQRFYGLDAAVQTDDDLEMQKRINAYREQVVAALGDFDQQIRIVQTTKELCEQTYLLLEDLNIPARLEQMRSYYDEHGLLEKGREQDQVWDAIIQLLDEMVEMIGDEEISLATFRAILEAGFESLTFSHVPPSIDHVIVATVDHSRVSQVKCTFLLGVNDGVWPQKPPGEGLLSDEERDLLNEHGLPLAENNRRKLLDDWFYMYIAFTTVQDQLWVSYVLSDEEGKTKMPSPLIQRMKDLFSQCQDMIFLQDPDDLVEAERFITTPFKTRSALTSQLARYQRGYPMRSIWMHVLNWYIENEEKFGTTYQVLQSLYYQNKPVELSEGTVEKLYPKQLKTSVSRLEMYYRCSFQHFAQYNLRLQERKTYKLDAPDIGQLFHEALKLMTEWVISEGRDLATLQKEDADEYAKRAIKKLAPLLQHQILMSSNRYQYIQQKLQEVVSRAGYILSEQARRSGFTPIGIELSFGERSPLKPVSIMLPNGFELVLRGRIDRVDQAQNEEGLFLRIIDYKSSSRGLDLVEVYYGLALQMLVYLDVIISQSEEWLGIQAKPAGMLYFHVHNAMLSNADKIADEQIANELFKQYKMQGLLLADTDVVKMMDTQLESGSSDVVPVGLKKNGGFYTYSKIASDENFADLQHHIRQLVYQAGIDLTSGDVKLNPYAYKQRTACTYCPFLSVCQFDPVLEENNYRKIQNMREEDVLAKLKTELKEETSS